MIKDEDVLLKKPLTISEAYTVSPHKGLRYNNGKLRYDLVHPYAHEQLVKVLTLGANKYAERNWEKGMSWSTVMASAERHLAAIKKGEDYDPETGLLHAAHLACNAHFLTAYYKIYPQGDDRPRTASDTFKIGLDIDGVLADFDKSLLAYYGESELKEINYWSEPGIVNLFTDEIKNNPVFWATIEPLMYGGDLPFEPHCYITARSIDKKITQQWLDSNGFPKKPLYSVSVGGSKVQAAKEAGINIFIDDCYDNYVELNNAGICTFLYTKSYNEKYNVGHRRIGSLQEFKERFLC